MEIQVRLTKPPQIPLPAYQTPASAGMDLRAALDAPLVLEPGARSLIPTALRLEIPPDTKGRCGPAAAWPSSAA